MDRKRYFDQDVTEDDQQGSSSKDLEPEVKQPNLGEVSDALFGTGVNSNGSNGSGGVASSLSNVSDQGCQSDRCLSVESRISNNSNNSSGALSSSTAFLSSGGNSGSTSGVSDSASGGNDGRTTLFISGLPVDTKPRELYLMCRLMPGYERSVLQAKSFKHPVGFVTFSSKAQAEAAKQMLHGLPSDPYDQNGRTLRVEFARKTTFEGMTPSVVQANNAATLLSTSNLSGLMSPSQNLSGLPLMPMPAAAKTPGAVPIGAQQQQHAQQQSLRPNINSNNNNNVALLNLASYLQQQQQQQQQQQRLHQPQSQVSLLHQATFLNQVQPVLTVNGIALSPAMMHSLQQQQQPGNEPTLPGAYNFFSFK